MGLILDFFTRNFPDDDFDQGFEAEVEKHLTAFQPKCEPTILDRAATIVSDTLNNAHATKVRLEAEIAEKRELLRQTNVVIEAFTPSLTRLDDGYDPTDDAKKSYEVAVAAKQKRGDRHFKKPQLEAAE